MMRIQLLRLLARIRRLYRRTVPRRHRGTIVPVSGAILLVVLWIWTPPPGFASILLAGWAMLIVVVELKILRKTAAIIMVLGLVVVEFHSIIHEHHEFFARLDKTVENSDKMLLNLTGDSYPYAVPISQAGVIYLRLYNDGKYPLASVSVSVTHKTPSEETLIGVNNRSEYNSFPVAIPGGTYVTEGAPFPVPSPTDTFTIYLASSTKLITEVLQLRKADSQAPLSYRFWAVIGSTAPDTPESDIPNAFRIQLEWSDVRIINPPAAIPPAPTLPAATAHQ